MLAEALTARPDSRGRGSYVLSTDADPEVGRALTEPELRRLRDFVDAFFDDPQVGRAVGIDGFTLLVCIRQRKVMPVVYYIDVRERYVGTLTWERLATTLTELGLTL